MGTVIDMFSRKAVDAPLPPTLRQQHLAFCGDDLTRLFYAAGHFMAYDAEYPLLYAAKLKNIRALQRNHILPAHADMQKLQDLILARDFEGMVKFEYDLRLTINQIECSRENWQMTEGQWLSVTNSVDWVRISILQDTTDLLVQAEIAVLLCDAECRELARLAEKDPGGLTQYTIDFIHTQYKGPAELHLKNLIDARLVGLGLKQTQPHLRPI